MNWSPIFAPGVLTSRLLTSSNLESRTHKWKNAIVKFKSSGDSSLLCTGVVGAGLAFCGVFFWKRRKRIEKNGPLSTADLEFEENERNRTFQTADASGAANKVQYAVMSRFVTVYRADADVRAQGISSLLSIS